jgi:hypothetical protein
MAIDIGLGMAVPGHEVAKFTRKQDSLHGLVVKREHSEQSFPYRLATQLCANTVFGEDGEGVSAGVPQCPNGEIALSPSFWYISAHMHNFCILETIVVSPCTLETM